MSRWFAACVLALTALAGPIALAQSDFEDLVFLDLETAVPSFTVEEFHPDIKWSGRINTIAVHPTDASRITVASGSGGLFQSADGGETWRHLDGLPVFFTISVAYDPADPRILIATSTGDFKRANGAGIWRSADGGETWAQASINSFPYSCVPGAAAWGIAFEPDTNVVHVATDCGMARSDDAGLRWTRSIRGAIVGSRNVFRSVEALGGGRVVGVGEAGFFYSLDGGGNWERGRGSRLGPADGYHALARSPRTPDGVYAIDKARRLFFSGDAGITWVPIDGPGTGRDNCGGLPFVKAADTGAIRDLLHVGNRCSVYTGGVGRPWTRADVEHDDVRDLALVDAVPTYLATDGGFHKPIGEGGRWISVGGGSRGLDALELYEVTGQRIAPSPLNPFSLFEPRRHDLYVGTQDNDLWSTNTAGLTWPFFDQYEGFFIDLVRSVRDALGSKVVFTACGPCNTKLSDPLFRNIGDFEDPANCAGPYALLDEGVFMQPRQTAYVDENGKTKCRPTRNLMVTENHGEDWRFLTSFPEELSGRPQVSAPSRPDPVVYMPFRDGSDDRGRIDHLMRVSGYGRGPVSRRYPSMRGHGGLGRRTHGSGYADQAVFAVDPSDPMHLIAPDPRDEEIKESWDGGDEWDALRGARQLVTRNGVLNSLGVTSLISAVSFQPSHAQLVLMGGREGGVYFSHDRGRTFEHVPGSERIPNVTSFHWKTHNEAYVSSYGRGLWRLRIAYAAAPPSFAKLCGGTCLLADVAAPDPRPFDGKIDFEAALLVYEGGIMDARIEGGLLRGVAVTPGSAWVLASPPGTKQGAPGGEAVSPPALKAEPPITETNEAGDFKGLEAARQLLEQGWVIKGLTVAEGKVKHVVVSRNEAVVQGPGRVVPFVDTGEPESGVLKRASLTADYDAERGLVTVSGALFRPGLPVSVTFDGSPVKRQIRARHDGSFRRRLRRRLTPGLYSVLAEQVDADGQRVFDVTDLAVGTGDGDEGTDR
jgi:photosystem II stability/assembly factor-like uncharacterized protein